MCPTQEPNSSILSEVRLNLKPPILEVFKVVFTPTEQIQLDHTSYNIKALEVVDLLACEGLVESKLEVLHEQQWSVVKVWLTDKGKQLLKEMQDEQVRTSSASDTPKDSQANGASG